MADGNLLELRVHGVNNTPPVSMLYAIQQEYGDPLVGVYRERQPRGVVKALSWGGLARLSPLPRVPFAKWVQSVTSAGWILVIPFGLANVAYWSRRLTQPGEPYEGVRTTAALVRVFSLGLTLLLISSVCSVSLDMAETRVQALIASDSDARWVALLRHTDAGDRLAVLSLAPVVAISLLWFLATRTRVRYDRGVKLPPSTRDRTSHWKIGSASFWDNSDLSAHNTGVHSAASLAMTLMWTGQFWSHEHAGFGRLVTGLSGAILLICVVLTLTAPLVTEENVMGMTRRAAPHALAAVAAVIFVVQFVALIGWSPSVKPQPLTLLSSVPGVIVSLLLVLAISALGWRSHARLAYAFTVALIGIGVSAFLAEGLSWIAPRDVVIVDVVLIIALPVVAVMWACWLRWREGTQVSEAWHGAAPGVLMILALFAAVLLSTVFVVVAAALIGDGDMRISPSEIMTARPIYLSFASMLLPTILALVFVLAVTAVAVLRFGRMPVEQRLDRTTQPDEKEMACLAEIFDTSQRAGAHGNLYRRRCRTRRLASLAHRAEPMVAWLAVIAAAAITGGLALAVLLYDYPAAQNATYLLSLQKWGVWVGIGIGIVIVGHGVAHGRPLGIVWDLICFLPRAAHPFGPPCYAQRAIPELHTYCRAWLESPASADEDAEPRRLVLSAHSLGGVLAVAVILLLSDKHRDRIALVTYGCQLRAYFSRIFPELLGPRILGVTESSPARLVKCPTFPPDPPPVPSTDDYPLSILDTLRDADGTPRWINLWRPTDYLGFPAYSREPDNPVDRPADEVTAEKADQGEIVIVGTDTAVRMLTPQEHAEAQLEFRPRWTVQVDTHSDYFRTRQYPSAVDVLTQHLAHSTTPRGQGPPGVS